MAYPGRPAAEAITPAGVRFGSSAGFCAGIVTRGVLLDLAVDGPLPEGYAVSGEDLDSAEERQGVHVESGDALVVRMDWEFGPNPEVSQPGIGVDAVRWMHRRGFRCTRGMWGTRFRRLTRRIPLRCTPLASGAWECRSSTPRTSRNWLSYAGSWTATASC